MKRKWMVENEEGFCGFSNKQSRNIGVDASL